MAKQTLPVNFQDDIMNSSMGGKRRYQMINNTDGTISLEDVTTYDQVGSNFGAGQINQVNTAVNAAADAGKIIQSLATVNATTVEGYIAGSLSVKELYYNTVTEIYVGTDGKLHKIKGGADTVLPFSSTKNLQVRAKAHEKDGVVYFYVRIYSSGVLVSDISGNSLMSKDAAGYVTIGDITV